MLSKSMNQYLKRPKVVK